MGGKGGYDPFAEAQRVYRNVEREVTNATSSGFNAVTDAAGTVTKNISAPISQGISSFVDVAENGINTVNDAAGNLRDAYGNVISQAGKAAGNINEAVVKAGRDASRETAQSANKLARSAKKEFDAWEKYNREWAGSTVKGLEKTTSGLARGDFKRFASGALDTIDSTKKYALENFKFANKGGLDTVSEIGRGIDSKALTDIAEDVRREGNKGVDIFGPIAIDLVADWFTAGGYSTTRSGLEAMKKDGIQGLKNEEFLKDVAIQVLTKNSKVKDWAAANGIPEGALNRKTLEAIREAASGDLEKAAYAGVGVDPDAAKSLREIVTGDKSVEEAIKEILLKQASERFGIDQDVIKSAMSGNFSRAITSLAEQELSKTQKDVANLIKKAKSIGDLKKLPYQAAAEYFDMDPQILSMANKVIKDPKGTATEALASRAGINTSAIQNIRNGLSGDLRGGAMQAIGGSMGIHPLDLQLMQSLNNGDYRSLQLQALADEIGIPAQYLQMAQSELSNRILGESDELSKQNPEKQTNNLEGSGKKMSEIIGEDPENIMARYFNTNIR